MRKNIFMLLAVVTVMAANSLNVFAATPKYKPVSGQSWYQSMQKSIEEAGKYAGKSVENAAQNVAQNAVKNLDFKIDLSGLDLNLKGFEFKF